MTFHPHLVSYACPVCGLDVPAPDRGRLGTWLSDPANRIVAIVVGATVANAALLIAPALLIVRPT